MIFLSVCDNLSLLKAAIQADMSLLLRGRPDSVCVWLTRDQLEKGELKKH